MRAWKLGILAVLLSISNQWFVSPAIGQQVPTSFPLAVHTVRDKLGRTITYYLSRPKRPAPLLLLIQGSGCATVIKGQDGDRYSSLFDLLPFAAEGRFAVMAVEKPEAVSNASDGTAQGCTAKFNEDFTAERWLVALKVALDDAHRQTGVDGHRTVVLGGSEGQ